MGTREDRQRAERVRERGREEREEAAAHAREQSARETERRERHQELLAASCYGASWFGTTDFQTGIVAVGILALASSVTAFLKLSDRTDQFLALAGAGTTVVLATLLLILNKAVRARMNAAWDAETQWLGRLPFKVDGIDDGIASTSSHQQLHLRLTFKVHNEMPLADTRQLLPHVDPGATAERHGEKLEIIARLAGNPASDVARVRARRLLLHDLVDGVLLPLNERAPIKRIELDD